MKNYLVTALVALVCGFGGAALWSVSGLGHAQTREYLVAHPEVLADMAQAFEKQQRQDALAGLPGDVKVAFPGAVLGNPNGTKTLVKFTDYGCTYCRQSVADTDRLIAENPDLKVVVREWPIFEGSEAAARMALAAAKQGKFAAFYHAMFELGPPNDMTISAAAQKAGMDWDRAVKDAASQDVTAELTRNHAYAQALKFSGTPSWIVGDKMLEGAVGFDALSDAITAESN